MSPSEITSLSVCELIKQVKDKKLKPIDVAHAYIEVIEKRNPKINAFLFYNPDHVLEQVEELEVHPEMLLPAVPIVVSDRCAVKGIPQTLGTKLLPGELSSCDSLEVERLKKEGAIIIGTGNCSELYLTTETENPISGKTENPWGPQLDPGGAEGGTAAAVASQMAAAGVAIDGLGSVRLTSSFQGVLGFKPTYKVIPLVREHHIPYSNALFYQISTITRTSQDCAKILNVLSDRDEYKPSFSKESYEMGYSTDFGFSYVDDETKEQFSQAIERLNQMGQKIKPYPVELNSDIYKRVGDICYPDNYLPMQKLIEGKSPSEVPDIIRHILIKGKSVSGIEFSHALVYIDWIKRYFGQIFEEIDFLVTPAAPCHAGNSSCHLIDSHFGLWSLLMPCNLSGNPSVSVPMGMSKKGTPIGIQIIGRKNEEQKLLSLIAQIEELTPWRFLAY